MIWPGKSRSISSDSHVVLATSAGRGSWRPRLCPLPFSVCYRFSLSIWVSLHCTWAEARDRLCIRCSSYPPAPSILQPTWGCFPLFCLVLFFISSLSMELWMLCSTSSEAGLDTCVPARPPQPTPRPPRACRASVSSHTVAGKQQVLMDMRMCVCFMYAGTGYVYACLECVSVGFYVCMFACVFHVCTVCAVDVCMHVCVYVYMFVCLSVCGVWAPCPLLSKHSHLHPKILLGVRVGD